MPGRGHSPPVRATGNRSAHPRPWRACPLQDQSLRHYERKPALPTHPALFVLLRTAPDESESLLCVHSISRVESSRLAAILGRMGHRTFQGARRLHLTGPAFPAGPGEAPRLSPRARYLRCNPAPTTAPQPSGSHRYPGRRDQARIGYIRRSAFLPTCHPSAIWPSTAWPSRCFPSGVACPVGFCTASLTLRRWRRPQMTSALTSGQQWAWPRRRVDPSTYPCCAPQMSQLPARSACWRMMHAKQTLSSRASG
jgi:hypothetical protein